jgi:hypothetical protein
MRYRTAAALLATVFGAVACASGRALVLPGATAAHPADPAARVPAFKPAPDPLVTESVGSPPLTPTAPEPAAPPATHHHHGSTSPAEK